MAALESTQSVRFALPLSNPPFCNSNTLRPVETSRSIHSLNTAGSQKIRGPAATLSRSRCQADAEGNPAARPEGRKRALANNDDESDDDDLPSLEEVFRHTPRSRVATATSNTERTIQQLGQPALELAGIPINLTESGLGDRQGDSPGRPMIVDDDESDDAGVRDKAEGASGDVDIGRVRQDASPHNTLTTSELACESAESIDTSGPWWDVEDRCWICEPDLRLASCEQQPFAPTQDEPKILPQPPSPPQDPINQQDINTLNHTMSLEATPRSLPKPSGDGDDEWTQDSMAGLEKEGVLVLVEQVESSSRSVPNSPHPPRSVEALKELAGQLEEFVRPAVGEHQDLAEVDDADDPENKEATETLPATQLEINEHRFRLRGIRDQKLAGRKTTQYRVVWGEHPNRSESWVDEDDVRISILQLPSERSFQDLALQTERDTIRVRRMRCSEHSQGRKVFEYFVNKPSTWITEGQLRISPSPKLLAKLEVSSLYTPSQAQSKIHLKRPATLINDDKHCHPSRTSRSPSSPSGLLDPVASVEPKPENWEEKPGHQDAQNEVYSDGLQSADAYHDTCDTGDEDPRPPKRRKRRSAPADVQPQALRTSRSFSKATDSVLVTEYEEWPLQGFLKRTKIGSTTSFNLEFHLTQASENPELWCLSEMLCTSIGTSAKHQTSHSAIAHSKTRNVKSTYSTKRIPWTEKEEETLVQMKEEDGCSWKEISDKLPSRTTGAIQVRYFTKQIGRAHV